MKLAVFLFVLAHGVFSVGTDGLSAFVMEGDSVTLRTNVETKQQEDIKWYFNDTRIAQITGDLSYICTDVQCNEGTERFRDRLKLDHQTGSLTITNTRNIDSGVYDLKIISIRNSSEKTFSVTVHDVSAAERDEMKRKSVKEGESVTLDPGVMKNPNDLMTWHFNDLCIAEISEEPRMICTDVQCINADERFRDRLKLDHQTGSLTIMNTRTTDSGDYTVNIKGSGKPTINNFTLIVYDSTGSKSQTALISSAVAGSLLIVAAVGIYYICRRHRKTDQEGTDQTRNDEITYAEPTFYKQKAQKPGVKREDEVLYAGVVTRN